MILHNNKELQRLHFQQLFDRWHTFVLELPYGWKFSRDKKFAVFADFVITSKIFILEISN